MKWSVLQLEDYSDLQICNFYMQDDKVFSATVLFQDHAWRNKVIVVKEKSEHTNSLLLLPQVIILCLGKKIKYELE